MSAAGGTGAVAPVRHGWLVRLVAGRRAWGWLDVWPTRYGYTHYRLVVCPPGTNTSERALLRLWRAWPAVAVLTGCFLVLPSEEAGLLPVPVSVIAAAGIAAVLAALASATRRQRAHVRARLGGTEHGGGRRTLVGDMPLIERCWDRLVTADDALAAGEITALQHEIEWARAWDDLARTPATSAATSRRP